MTLTNCAQDWQTLRRQVRDFRYRLVTSGRRCEWVWTVERGGRTGMLHVHAIQHGDYIGQKVLQSMWGGRITDVRQVHDAAEYISKSAARVAGYIVKGAADGGSGLAIHLGLNGGRLHHWSRDFWGGLTIRQAVQASRGGPSEDRFVVVFRGDSSDVECVERARQADALKYREWGPVRPPTPRAP